MSGHSLALLGGLLAICIGVTVGQTTEEPDATSEVIENTDTPSESTDWSTPEPDATSEVIENTDTPSESTDWSTPGYSAPPLTSDPSYPPYPTTGRCGLEPQLCCPGRNDFCQRVNCYCDEACYLTFKDCCEDYFPACQGAYGPPGYTASDVPPSTEDPWLGKDLFGSPTSDVPPSPEDPWLDTLDSTPGGNTAPPNTASTFGDRGWTEHHQSHHGCIPAEPGRRFAIMCSGQRSNLIRRCDWYGCGSYMGPRGQNYYKGVDVVCRDGSTVYAPFTGAISTHDMCYGDEQDRPTGEGFTFSGSGFCVKIFNVNPGDHHGPIKKGDPLGTMVPMQPKYPCITSHIFIQKCDLSDPTGLL